MLLPMLLALSLGQGRPPAPVARDGGVAEARKPAAGDGGVVRAEAAPAPAADLAQRAELEHVKRDLEELRVRTALLEKQVATNEAVTEQLEKVNRQLGELKTQLGDAEERRSDAERRAVERRAQVEATTSWLVAAQNALATGSSNVGDALRAAEAVYTGAALRDVQYARQALANGDSAAARQYIALAILEVQAQSRP